MLKLFRTPADKSPEKTRSQERRALPRAKVAKGVALVDGANLQLVNWNIRGFLASDYDGRHEIGMRVKTKLIIPGKLEPLSFGSDGEVVRVERAARRIAVRFIDMDRKVFEDVKRYVAANRTFMKWDLPRR